MRTSASAKPACAGCRPRSAVVRYLEAAEAAFAASRRSPLAATLVAGLSRLDERPFDGHRADALARVIENLDGNGEARLAIRRDLGARGLLIGVGEMGDGA